MVTQQGPIVTLQDVWKDRSAERAFPVGLVEGAKTAAAFFAAAFYGRNDVIYLDHLEIPDIVLVDTDRFKLSTMAKIYPTVVETWAEDAYEVADRMRHRGRTFDVVLCDPFGNQDLRVLREHFDTFSSLASRSWVTGVSLGNLGDAGIEPTMDGVQTWLDTHGRGGWEVAWLEVRNDTTELSWLGLRRRVPNDDDEQLRHVIRLVDDVLGTARLGVYLHGSSVLGGRLPASDIDIIVVTTRTLDDSERRALAEGLLYISSYDSGLRPIELIVVAESDVRPWRYPPTCDFLYGEWERERCMAGLVPQPEPMPQLTVELTLALIHGRALAGPQLADVIGPIPPADLLEADRAGLPELIADLNSHTRRVVLTLARIWSRLATGEVRSKDAAAAWALPHLSPTHRPVLEHAKELNLHHRLADDHWPSDLISRLGPYADEVLARIQELADHQQQR